jgi:hypothetical protein
MDRQRLWCRPKILRAKLFDLPSATGLYAGLIAENFGTNAYRKFPGNSRLQEFMDRRLQLLLSWVGCTAPTPTVARLGIKSS